MSTRAIRRLAAAALAIGFLAGSAGCGGDEPAAPTPVATSSATTTTASTTTSTVTTTATPTTTTAVRWSPDLQPVVDAYLGFYDSYIRVQTTPALPTSELSEFAGGGFLARLQAAIEASRAEGKVNTKPPDSVTRAEVIHVEAIEGGWRLEACEVDDLVLRYADGSIDDTTLTSRYVYGLDSLGGRIQVIESNVAGEWQDDSVTQCLASS